MRCSRRGGGATAQAARIPWSMGYADRRGAERLSRYQEEEFEERGHGSWLAHQQSYMRSINDRSAKCEGPDCNA